MSIVKGLVAGNAAFVAQTFVRLLSTAVVARLISPEEMGIWTLGFALIGMFQILRDFGTATYIHTAKELSRDDVRACTSIQVAVGIAFFLIFVIAAKFVAAFYREPRVAEVIYVLALGFLIMPWSSTIFNTFVRDGRFALKSGIDFAAQMVIYAGGVCFAFIGASHLSAPIAVVIAQVLVVVLCLRYRNKAYPLGLGLKSIKSVARLSGTALSVSVLQHASDRAPDYVLPKTQGFAQSSIYEKGVNSLELVRMATVELLGSILVSALRSRTQDNESGFPLLAANSLTGIFLFACMGAGILAINARDFLLVLFGPQWASAQVTLEVLAWSTPFVCVTAFLTKIMYLKQMHSTVLKIAVTTRLISIATVLALGNSSLFALATGIAVLEVIYCFVYCYLNRETVAWSDCALGCIIDACIILLCAFVAHYAVGLLGLGSALARLLIDGAISVILILGVLFVFRQVTVVKIKHCLGL